MFLHSAPQQLQDYYSLCSSLQAHKLQLKSDDGFKIKIFCDDLVCRLLCLHYGVQYGTDAHPRLLTNESKINHTSKLQNPQINPAQT